MVIPAIVNMVYKKLLKHDITARVFSNRDSRNEENPERFVEENGNIIQNRKIFLRWYLTKLNSDPTKMEYWEYLDKVGYAKTLLSSRPHPTNASRLMHIGRGRRNPLHVDYIFLGACLGYIQDALTEAILSHPKLHLQRKIAIVKAIGKVIWIQNDLLAKWHTRDGGEYLDAEHDEAQEEPEGYLHGKKVFGDGDSVSTRSSSSGKTSLGRSERDVEESMPMRCPFSGLEMGEQRAEMTRPALKGMLDESRQSPVRAPPSGAPKLHLIDGKVMGKDKLDVDLFGKQ